MSKLSQLQGKSKTYNIGGVELELRPLRLDDFHLIALDEKASPEEQAKSTALLINKVLKDAVPDSTEEERNSLGLEHMESLMQAIMDVNNLSKKASIKDVLAARQAQAKN